MPATAGAVPPALLGLAMFRPERAGELLGAYPGELALAWAGERAVGVLGYRVARREATILHIGVEPAHRRRGVGRALIDWLGARAEAMVAETDAGAAGFYRRCGFRVEPAGKRGGTLRYLATRNRDAGAAGCGV